MSDPVLDVEVVSVRDPETDETFEAVVIPDGFVVCLMRREEAERFSGWTECAALRIEVDEDDTIASLEITDDEEWVTGPDAT